jgi:hypothetical protein
VDGDNPEGSGNFVVRVGTWSNARTFVADEEGA